MLKKLPLNTIRIFLFVSICIFSVLDTKMAYSQADKELVGLADELFAYGDYSDALAVYLQATIENPDNVRGNFMVGRCYLYTVDGKANAVDFLLNAHKLDPEVSNKIFYYIAEGYRHSHQFDEAVTYYEKYLEELEFNRRAFVDLDIEKEVKKIDRRIVESHNAKKYIANPMDVAIENLGYINSEYRDYSPILSVDEDLMIFTSRRYGTTGGLKDNDVEYFEDIYYCEKEGDTWGEVKNIGAPVNTESHESALALSPDGNTLYLYNTENNGDVYYSEKSGSTWSKPKPFKEINSEYREEAMSITEDNQFLFFQTDRPGGVGATDIWRCEKQSDGSWGKPEVLSDRINTEWDDASPYFDVNSSTLYFSSRGHDGMGGFDLYKSTYDEASETWSMPENLGYPINTTDDDHFFTLLEDGETAYYSSFKEDSHGSMDLYKIYPFSHHEHVKKEPEEVVEVDSSEVESEPVEIVTPVATPSYLQVSINVMVRDIDTREPINGSLEILTKDRAEKLYDGTISSSGYTTAYSFDEDKVLIFVASADGYQFASTNAIVPGNALSEKTIVVEVYLKKPKLFRINRLRNIYFEFDKFTLKQASFAELDKLATMMKESPSMKIEVAGHTDYIGSHDYNVELSTKRAKSVKKYLEQKGIESSRITSKGYGESKPLASNDDEEEGRELNRRTEFIIIQK